MTTLLLRIASVALALVGTACANRSGLHPTLTLADSSCASEPDLARASPVPLDPEKPAIVTVDAAASCLQSGSSERRAYAVFALPETKEPYLISVSSSLRGHTLLSPRLAILDASGKTMRERQRDAFTFRGTSLYAGMRAYPGDRYLLVESDPDTVGQRISQINSSSQMNGTATGTGGVIFWGVGADTKQDFTYAHNGTLVVSARPFPPTN
jgi:hypothetical protein